MTPWLSCSRHGSGEQDGDHWVARLNAAQVPAGRVNTIPEALALAERLGLEPTVDVGDGWTPQVRHPVAYTAYRTAQPSPPALGADSTELRTRSEGRRTPTPCSRSGDRRPSAHPRPHPSHDQQR